MAENRDRTALFLAPFNPLVRGAGNRERTRETLEVLKGLGFEVILVVDHSTVDVPNSNSLWEKVEKINFPRSWYWRSFFSLKDEPKQESFSNDVARISRQYGAEVCMVNYAVFANAFLRLDPRVLRIIDSHELFSSPGSSTGLVHGWLPYLSRFPSRKEKHLLRQADVVLTLSDEDNRVLQRWGLEAVSSVLRLLPTRLPVAKKTGQIRVYGLLMNRNLENMLGLLSLVFWTFLLSRGKPPFVLVVAGSISEGTTGRLLQKLRLRWLKPVGFVNPLENFYNSIDCAVSPTTRGNGARVKFVEAIAFGIPVLATKRGSRGARVFSRHHQFPNPRALARALLTHEFSCAELAEESHRAFTAQKDLHRKEVEKLRGIITVSRNVN